MLDCCDVAAYPSKCWQVVIAHPQVASMHRKKIAPAISRHHEGKSVKEEIETLTKCWAFQVHGNPTRKVSESPIPLREGVCPPFFTFFKDEV